MTRVAILDDYQSVALDMANWDSLPSEVVVDVFSDHLSISRERLSEST